MIGDNEIAIYDDAVALLKTVPGIKRVEMFNNQIEKEDQTDVGLYPAVFIEIQRGNFVDLGARCQKYDCTVTLHVAFETNKINSRDLLVLKQQVFATFHGFQPTTVTTVGRFLRYSNEDQDTDHDNLEQYIQIYLCQNVMEYDADTRPSIPVTVTPTITPTIVTEITN